MVTAGSIFRRGTALGIASTFAALVLSNAASAGWPPPGVPSGVMPWELPKYLEYKERLSRPPQPAPPVATTHTYTYPQQSTIQITLLPQKNTDPKSVAYVMVHIPMGADLWVEDAHMISNNKLEVDTLVTPPLVPDTPYLYHFRVRWYENGKWVSQMHAFWLKAGDVHCLDVVPQDSATLAKTIAAGLARLDEKDRKVAEAQKYCAVQDTIRLGSMGKPVKVSVNGKDVYLCCEGCRKMALKDPDKTLKTVEKLKEQK